MSTFTPGCSGVLLKVATVGLLLGVFHGADRSSDLGARPVNDRRRGMCRT
jgi:hypothetical protein